MLTCHQKDHVQPPRTFQPHSTSPTPPQLWLRFDGTLIGSEISIGRLLEPALLLEQQSTKSSTSRIIWQALLYQHLASEKKAEVLTQSWLLTTSRYHWTDQPCRPRCLQLGSSPICRIWAWKSSRWANLLWLCRGRPARKGWRGGSRIWECDGWLEQRPRRCQERKVLASIED